MQKGQSVETLRPNKAERDEQAAEAKARRRAGEAGSANWARSKNPGTARCREANYSLGHLLGDEQSRITAFNNLNRSCYK